MRTNEGLYRWRKHSIEKDAENKNTVCLLQQSEAKDEEEGEDAV